MTALAVLTVSLSAAGLIAPAAEAAAPPALSWAPATAGTYDFGTVSAATSQVLRLTNSGGTATGALNVVLSGSAYGKSQDHCSAASLGPRKSCTVTVTYTPSTSGLTDTGSLTASSKRPAVRATIALSGTGTPPSVPAADPTVTTDAAGFYVRTYTWTISKSADTSTLNQPPGTEVKPNYTVTLDHSSGFDGGIVVNGTIDVENANFDSSFATVPVTLSSVSGQLSDGTVCTVDTSPGLTLADFDNYFSYSCSLGSLPGTSLGLKATAAWSAQTLSDSSSLAAGSADFTYSGSGNSGIAFTPTYVDDCVAVSDTLAGDLGNVCTTDPAPKVIQYSLTFTTPFGCENHDNTATYVTDTTATQGSSSWRVTLCGD